MMSPQPKSTCAMQQRLMHVKAEEIKYDCHLLQRRVEMEYDEAPFGWAHGRDVLYTW